MCRWGLHPSTSIYNEVLDTPLDEDLPCAIFQSLPEWCVYVETPDFVYDGALRPGYFFGLFEAHQGAPAALAWYGPGTTALPCPVFQTSIVGLRQRFFRDKPALEPAIHRALSLTLYLCAQNADLGDGTRPENPAPTKTKHGLRTFPRDQVRKWDVGSRIAAELRASSAQPEVTEASEASDDDADARRARPRPHTRRSHSHRYWIKKRSDSGSSCRCRIGRSAFVVQTFPRSGPMTQPTIGPVSLVIEAHVEGELIGSEHVWRVCVERTATAEAELSPFSSQTTPLQSPHYDQPPRQQLYVLLVNLFTVEKLRRWIGLRDVRWGDDLPSGTASLDDLAYAVVDSGLRSRRVDGAFFDSLIVEFPRFRPEITKIQQIMLDAT